MRGDGGPVMPLDQRHHCRVSGLGAPMPERRRKPQRRVCRDLEAAISEIAFDERAGDDGDCAAPHFERVSGGPGRPYRGGCLERWEQACRRAARDASAPPGWRLERSPA